MAKHAAAKRIENGAAIPGPRAILSIPSRRALLAGAGALIALLLVLMAGLLAARGAGGLDPDCNAQQGTLHASAADVPAGSFRLVLNQTPAARAGSRKLDVEFENPAANAYAGRLTLRLDDGRELGETPLVEPGSYVRSLEMREDLAEGAYPALAEVKLFEGDREAGSSSARVEVRVTG